MAQEAIEWDTRTNAESGNDEGSTGAPGCRICGAPITGKMRIFCSKECAQKAKLVGKKEVPSPIYTERACMDCGKVMMLHIKSKRCPECQLAANRQQSVAGKRRSALGLTRPLGSVDRCVRCGEEYIVTGPLQKYCASCAEIGAKEATRINRREKMREKLKDVEWCAERNARRCAQRKERRAKIEVDGRKVPRTSSGQSKIARKRIEAGLTQSQLGALVGVQGTYVGAWERGERKPKLDALMRLAAALGCDVTELIG